jgi:hypothetical protein
MHGFHDIDDAPPQERKHIRWQLYYLDGTPRQWFLSVDGEERRSISSKELSIQSRWRTWHLDNGYKPPDTEKYINKFEEIIGELFDSALRVDQEAPFLATDAQRMENLKLYFQVKIGPMLWEHGKEFEEGKYGDYVRLRLDHGRIYFKWESMNSWFRQGLHLKEAELQALKVFIIEKGGYQSKTGIKGWFRCTYWLPWELFDPETREEWARPPGQREEEEGE